MSAELEFVEESGVTYVRREGALEEIPVLDLGPYFAGEAGAREKLVSELRHAQEHIGFYYIVNHGVPLGCSLAVLPNSNSFSNYRSKRRSNSNSTRT
jgi:isopenicillin N synthase-like dioxygenase